MSIWGITITCWCGTWCLWWLTGREHFLNVASAAAAGVLFGGHPYVPILGEFTSHRGMRIIHIIPMFPTVIQVVEFVFHVGIGITETK